ncbi:MAG: DUF4115 domain-containing protein [bacterium]|nr:DUF4115 domain-containing protein [bacterium]
MDLFSLGLYLKDTREAKEIALDKVERDLRIRRKVLESFEAGDFNLPELSPVQLRGFLRNYARYLGLDDERVVLLYEAAIQNANRRSRGRRGREQRRERPATISSTVPVVTAPSANGDKPRSEPRRTQELNRPATQNRRGLFRKRRSRQERKALREQRATQELASREMGQPLPVVPGGESVANPALTPAEFPAFTERPASRPRRDITDTDPALPRVAFTEQRDNRRLISLLNTLFIVAIAVAAIGIIAFVGSELIDLPGEEAPPEGILEIPPPQPTFNFAATLGFEPTPAPTQAVDTLGISQQFDGSGVLITLRAQQRTWLRVATDGSQQMNRLVLPDEVFEFRAQSVISLTASNAAALVVIYNGQPQEPFGMRGQAVDITFSPTAYDISTGPGFEPTSEFSPTPPPTQDNALAATLLAQQTPTATEGPSPTPSLTPTITPTSPFSPTPSATATSFVSPTVTFTPVPTNTPGPTPTLTETPPPTDPPAPTVPVPPRQGATEPTPTKNGA